MKLPVDIGQMPVGWEVKTIGEVTIIVNGGTPKSDQSEYWNGDIFWITPKDMGKLEEIYVSNTSRKISQAGLQKSSAKLIPENSVILSTRAPIGHLAINQVAMATNQGCRGLVPKLDLDTKFLFYFLKLNVQLLNELGTGTTFRELSTNALAGVKMPIPSLPEQKQIVAILDEAFEGIDRAIANAEKNLANARELFESYRNSILTQENRQWQETKLGAEIDLMTGFPFKSNRYTDSDQSIRLLRGDNIVQGALRWDDVKKWPESEINEYLSYQLKEGDVVLAMDRPWVKAGLKHAMISSDDLPCLLVQRTACLRGNKNINNRFLMYLIGSHSFIQHILSNQTGIGVPHISGKQIQSFKFLKPFLSEQNFISDSLDELRSKSQRLETIYRQKIAALNELKQSILQKAFTGELTADTANQTTKNAKEGIAA